MTTIGDNSNKQLISFVERIERQCEEINGLKEDLAETFSEVKAFGYDAAIVRKVIRLRAMDPAKRKEQEQLLDTYLAAIDGAENVK